jgi:hypothetical protein
VAAAEAVAVVCCTAAGAVVCGALVNGLFGDGVAVLCVVVALGRGLVVGLRVRVAEVVAVADAPAARVRVAEVAAVADAPAG